MKYIITILALIFSTSTVYAISSGYLYYNSSSPNSLLSTTSPSFLASTTLSSFYISQTGTEPQAGKIKLVAGKAVVVTKAFSGTSTTPILLSHEDCGVTVATCGELSVGSSTVNYGFTASSTGATDVSWIYWEMRKSY